MHVTILIAAFVGLRRFLWRLHAHVADCVAPVAVSRGAGGANRVTGLFPASAGLLRHRRHPSI